MDYEISALMGCFLHRHYNGSAFPSALALCLVLLLETVRLGHYPGNGRGASSIVRRLLSPVSGLRENVPAQVKYSGPKVWHLSELEMAITGNGAKPDGIK